MLAPPLIPNGSFVAAFVVKQTAALGIGGNETLKENIHIQMQQNNNCCWYNLNIEIIFTGNICTRFKKNIQQHL